MRTPEEIAKSVGAIGRTTEIRYIATEAARLGLQEGINEGLEIAAKYFERMISPRFGVLSYPSDRIADIIRFLKEEKE